MSITVIAPCGQICDLCSAFQREKNKCSGCTIDGGKPLSCTQCIIVNCSEKSGDPTKLCYICSKYPCKRLKDLNKRYSTYYGESLVENFQKIEQLGLDQFVAEAENFWRCPGCGELVNVHRPVCLHCNTQNAHYLRKSKPKPGLKTRTLVSFFL